MFPPAPTEQTETVKYLSDCLANLHACMRQLESQLETCKYFVSEVTKLIIPEPAEPGIDPKMAAAFAAMMSQMAAGTAPGETKGVKLGFTK